MLVRYLTAKPAQLNNNPALVVLHYSYAHMCKLISIHYSNNLRGENGIMNYKNYVTYLERIRVH